MEIAIYGREFGQGATQSVVQLFDSLLQFGVRLHLHKGFYQFLTRHTAIRLPEALFFEGYEDMPAELDFLISIGGDGTFLEAISLVRHRQIPIVGVNTGRLGFLANIAQEDIPLLVPALGRQDVQIDERSLLQLDSDDRLFGDFNVALNEATVLKTDTSSMITVHVYLDNEYLNSYWADGLIIATPTGSTAYSLSAGGPIVVPNSKNFIITPLAPHNLTVRPLVVPDDKEILIKIDGRNDTFLAALDYRSVTFGQNTELRIRKAPYTVRVVRLRHHSFFGTLRNKLMWGLDRRN